MSHEPLIRRPILVSQARYRWDKIRHQHQVVFPEGILVLNETGAAIVQCCDGRGMDELIGDLAARFPGTNPAEDVEQFVRRLASRGLVEDANDT